MTVKELIKELRKFPKNAKIAGFVSDDSYSGTIREVTYLCYDKEKKYVDISADDDGKCIERI